MDEIAEAKEKWSASADAWIAGMRRGDTNRTHLLDAAMVAACGDVAGLRVLDAGCGEGRFSRMLSSLGGYTTGFDLTSSLAAEAGRLDVNGSYAVANAEAVPIRNDVFDLVVSYVVLVDIADYRSAIAEMARVVRPGGKIVVANLNSFITTSQTGWFKDSAGKKMHFPVDGYFDERALRLSWSGMSIVNWHRPMQAYMSAFLDAGLVLRSFVEPKPSAEALLDRPDMIDETRIALFNVMVWQKPEVA